MTDSINNEFNKIPNAIEETKDHIREKAEPEYDEPHLTLEMDGELAEGVRQRIFEGKQAKIWMDNYQQKPELEQQGSERDLNQEFKQQAFKPLKASFFDSLSDENQAKIEAYKQANSEQSDTKQSHKKGISSKIS